MDSIRWSCDFYETLSRIYGCLFSIVIKSFSKSMQLKKEKPTEGIIDIKHITIHIDNFFI